MAGQVLFKSFLVKLEHTSSLNSTLIMKTIIINVELIMIVNKN